MFDNRKIVIFPFGASEWTRICVLLCIPYMYTAYISNVIEIEHKVREILQFLLFGWGERGGEASEWTRIYLFVCL